MVKDTNSAQVPGVARCPGPSTRDIILADGDQAPAPLTEESYAFLGDGDIDYDRYMSRDFLELETRKMWPKVWQFACRVEHIPDPGDSYVYDVGPYSVLIVRQRTGTIKAFINSCKHRGMQLRDNGSRGVLAQIRCPFHGFSWNIDGSFKAAPCEWDFPHIDADAFNLDHVHVDVWGGFVFINLDENPPPLSEYLEVMPAHFQHWPMENRHIALHIEKILPANWKLAQEAFLEAFHVLATHAQAVPYAGDANAQYDVFGENVSRFVHTIGFPSPHYTKEMTQADLLKALGGEKFGLTLGEGDTARSVYAEFMRNAIGDRMGVDLSEYSISEMIDSIEYHCFPNFFVFPGIGFPMVYRFRPNGDDVDTSIFDLMFMTLTPDGQTAPRPPDPIRVDAQTSFTEVEEMDRTLAIIYDQDTDNLLKHTRGLKTSRKSGQTLGNYQESRIRQTHITLDKYLQA